MQISRTYIATAVAFLGYLLKTFNQELPYDEEQVVNAISIVMAFGGSLWAIFERFSKGDVTWWGKKSPKSK